MVTRAREPWEASHVAFHWTPPADTVAAHDRDEWLSARASDPSGWDVLDQRPTLAEAEADEAAHEGTWPHG